MGDEQPALGVNDQRGCASWSPGVERPFRGTDAAGLLRGMRMVLVVSDQPDLALVPKGGHPIRHRGCWTAIGHPVTGPAEDVIPKPRW